MDLSTLNLADFGLTPALNKVTKVRQQLYQLYKSHFSQLNYVKTVHMDNIKHISINYTFFWTHNSITGI